jgi:hypothetical protein
LGDLGGDAKVTCSRSAGTLDLPQQGENNG